MTWPNNGYRIYDLTLKSIPCFRPALWPYNITFPALTDQCRKHLVDGLLDNDENTQFGFPLNPLTFLLDRGNDNWLINYEKTPEVDRQVEGEEGVSTFY